VDQFNDENDKFTRPSLDDYELGRLLGCGCNAAVYEARLRASPEVSSNTTSSTFIIPSERFDSESDIEILSRQSSDTSLLYEDVCEDQEDQLNELTLKEGDLVFLLLIIKLPVFKQPEVIRSLEKTFFIC
jgi:hypothetical protein